MRWRSASAPAENNPKEKSPDRKAGAPLFRIQVLKPLPAANGKSFQMCLLHKPIGRRAQASVTPIRAEVSGSETCTALAITVRGHAPILLLRRRLIEAGHDPTRPLHTNRDETLCLTISSISAGACLEVNAKGTGFIRHPAVRTAPPVAPTAKCLVQPHKQAVLAAARRAPSS
jgi:hypothetical protein